jgi:transcriptional regulator with PAS, ATPase and Fis domain
MAQLTKAPDVSDSGKDKNQPRDGFPKEITWLSGSTPRMRALNHELTRVAESDYPVLITGESGTGKTTVAQIVHQRSERASAPIVDINCAALPDGLLESELFGFERGAFTGAITDKKGLFETAHRGTLFLDEIGELKLELQAKLLKAIDGRKIRRLGGITDTFCDVRLIAASSRDLPRMISVGTFRDDLYYRLSVLQLDVPPLRDREPDIRELVYKRLAAEQAQLRRLESVQLDEGALKELCLYDWPGNIRQLQNVVARLACYTRGNRISVANVRAELARFKYLDSDTIALPDSCSTLFAAESFHDFSRRVQAAAIEAVKRRNNGNMSRVAARLKIDRSSLFRIAQRISAHCHSRANQTCRSATPAPGSHSPAQ